MLSDIREIKAGGSVIERTPLLVPSFSSKGFWDIRKVYEVVQPLIDRPILLSAYDLYYGKIDPPRDPTGLIFLDSGGYEASKDGDLSDYADDEPRPQPWGLETLRGVMDKWESPEPTVFVSYDHPEHRLSVEEQIAQALDLLPSNQHRVREILLKPEKDGQRFLEVDAILPHAEALSAFDLIGLTEKELGRTTAERMQNIAALRSRLNAVGVDTPIHIFGSLDTFNTILYFMSGADVFDGLTWLRFAFSEGQTQYKHVHASMRFGLTIDVDELEPSCWFDNYRYLRQMEREMRRYAHEKDFNVFQWNANELAQASGSVLGRKGGL